MKKVIYLYSVEPECTGCVVGVWCDTKEQVEAAIDTGEERIHSACREFGEFKMYRGYSVVKIGEV